MKLPILLLTVSVAGVAQTTAVDLRTQSKSVDFSNASLTKPARVGGALPPTCSTGEVFFNTNSSVGFNLYICATTNLWQALGAGGGGGAATSIMTSTVSTLPTSCSIGDVRFTIDASLAGGGFYTYWCTAANTWTQFGYVGGGSGALSSNCSSLPCTIDITAAVPLKAGANTWTGANDFSGAVKTAPFQAGAADPATCDPASREFFFNTTTNALKSCNSTNTWTALPLKAGANTWTGANDFSGAVKTAPFQAGAADPATCDPASREFFFNTTTNALKSCNSTNTWTVVGPAAGGLASVYYPVGLNIAAGSSVQMNWGVDASGPALTCNGTSPSPCYLTFSNSGLPKAAYLALVAPSSFTTLTVTVEWFSNTTAAGNIAMQADVQCLSKDSTAVIGVTPVWTGPQNAVTANNTSTQSVRRQTAFTAVGTCSAGDMMRVRFQRVAASDTYSDVIRFLGASVTY